MAKLIFDHILCLSEIEDNIVYLYSFVVLALIQIAVFCLLQMIPRQEFNDVPKTRNTSPGKVRFNMRIVFPVIFIIV